MGLEAKIESGNERHYFYRRVVENTFVGKLLDNFERFDDGREVFRQNQLKAFVNEIAPQSWYVAVSLIEWTDTEIKDRLYDPENVDHGIQHLIRVWQNFVVGSINNPQVMELSIQDMTDFMIAGAAACMLHDHLEIYSGMKKGHDHLGAVLVGDMLGKLMEVEPGLGINQRQVKLAEHAAYFHSYPERANVSDGMAIEILAVIDKYSQNEGVKLMIDKLQQLVGKITGGKIGVGSQDKFLADLLLGRVAAADKRDSMAPPFLANLRTVVTIPDRPFMLLGASEDRLTVSHYQHFIDKVVADGYVPTNEDFQDDLLRLVYELVRPTGTMGMSAFEKAWLEDSVQKRFDYLQQLGEAMLSGNFPKLVEKYKEYGKQLDKEAKLEGHSDEQVNEAMGSLNIQLFKTAAIVDAKSSHLRQNRHPDLSKSDVLTDFEQVINYAVKKRKSLTMTRHRKVPELPAFSLDLRP